MAPGAPEGLKMGGLALRGGAFLREGGQIFRGRENFGGSILSPWPTRGGRCGGLGLWVGAATGAGVSGVCPRLWDWAFALILSWPTHACLALRFCESRRLTYQVARSPGGHDFFLVFFWNHGTFSRLRRLILCKVRNANGSLKTAYSAKTRDGCES